MSKAFSHSYPRLASRPIEEKHTSSEAIVIPDTLPFGTDEIETLPLGIEPEDLIEKFNAEMPAIQEAPSERCVPYLFHSPKDLVLRFCFTKVFGERMGFLT